MIKVVIADNRAVIESVYESARESTRLAWAQEGLESRGYAVFDESGELRLVNDKDGIFELLIRAVLNHLDLKGVETAYTYNEAMFPPLYLLGFKKKGERLEINIKEFFSVKPCGGK